MSGFEPATAPPSANVDASLCRLLSLRDRECRRNRKMTSGRRAGSRNSLWKRFWECCAQERPLIGCWGTCLARTARRGSCRNTYANRCLEARRAHEPSTTIAGWAFGFMPHSVLARAKFASTESFRLFSHLTLYIGFSFTSPRGVGYYRLYLELERWRNAETRKEQKRGDCLLAPFSQYTSIYT